MESAVAGKNPRAAKKMRRRLLKKAIRNLKKVYGGGPVPFPAHLFPPPVKSAWKIEAEKDNLEN